MKLELANSLKGYKAKFLINDLMSGLLVAIIALPLSIALGIQSVPGEVSSNGIQAGIITAIVAGFAISAFGGSRFQIGGPTAAFVVILYNYIANVDIGILGLQFATILAGIWLILFGLLKVGNVMKYMPYPIVVGFTTGIGITLMIGQIKDFFGLNASGADAVEKVISYAQNISTFNWGAFLVGIIGLAIILIMQKINKKIPSAFIAIIVCTALTVLLNAVTNTQVPTIGTKYGNIKAEFYFINFSSLQNVKFIKLIVPSFVIAFLCMIESLLSATVADGMANTKHSSNQELLGQGVANILSPIFGGLPATGAIARTAANIKGGAKSSLSGVFHAVFILIMYFSLMGVLKFIPLAAFAAILISVAINMANFPLFVKLIKFGYRDSFVLIVTCLLTIFLDLTYGVLGGVVLTVLINIPNIKNKLTLEVISQEQNSIIIAQGAIYFISVNKLIDCIAKIPESSYEQISVDLNKVKNIDETSMERLATCSKKMKEKGKTLQLINCNDVTKKRIDKYFCIL